MINILIVEDDPMVRSINESYLEKAITNEPINIVSIDNGISALKLIKSSFFDLLLLDVYIPGISGVELLDKLQVLKIHPMVIMLTAADDVSHLSSAINYGVLDYLVKPFDFNRFKQSIDRYIQRRAMLNRRTSLNQDEINTLFNQVNQPNKDGSLPKGLTKTSLDKVMLSIWDIDEPFDVQDIARATKLSRISSKKYLDYLVQIKKLRTDVQYQSIGRPLTVYYRN